MLSDKPLSSAQVPVEGPSWPARIAMAALITSFTMCGVGFAREGGPRLESSLTVWVIGPATLGATLGRLVVRESIRLRPILLVLLAPLGLLLGALLREQLGPTRYFLPRLIDYLPHVVVIFVVTLLGTLWTREHPGERWWRTMKVLFFAPLVALTLFFAAHWIYWRILEGPPSPLVVGR